MFFFRSDESNCNKIQGGAKLSTQNVLKECFFDNNIIKNDKNINDQEIKDKNGFECGESHCIPLQYFCNPSFLNHAPFSVNTICPGFHLINKNVNK
jgi:hypothetical protein